MQRYQKELNIKDAKRKELFLKEHFENGELLFSCLVELERVVKKYQDELHVKLFGEEYDHMYDSNVDAIERRKGINPMSEAYQTKVNLKRVSMGFLPLSKNGMACDSDKTEAYCKDIILSLLCDRKV
jgi:hypothetical protein